MRLVIRALAAGLLLGMLLSSSPGRAAEAMLYRIELASGPVLLAKAPPVPQGARLVFARYPDGAVVSVKRGEVRRVISVPAVRDTGLAASGPARIRNLKPGELLILGPTGGGGSGGTGAVEAAETRPGETRGGKAVLNPDRDYRPEWDARQVPGASLPFPASQGDYREGRTFAYPPGSGTQASPGQPPTGVPTGEPPKSPQ